MKKSRLTLPGLVILCAALVSGAIALTVAADAIIRQSIITSGGGTAASGEVHVAGQVGQAITGRSSGPTTQIRGGWWASTGSKGIRQAGFIPLIMIDSCGAFAGTWECEDNDRPDQANGPLRLGQPLQGSLSDSNESGADQHTEDWFYFEWPGEGALSIDVTGFAPVGQVILYYESVDQGFVALLADQPSGDYHLAYDGGAGKYLIRLFVPGEARPDNAPDYTLLVSS